jgi:hypothetical protein
MIDAATLSRTGSANRVGLTRDMARSWRGTKLYQLIFWRSLRTGFDTPTKIKENQLEDVAYFKYLIKNVVQSNTTRECRVLYCLINTNDILVIQ